MDDFNVEELIGDVENQKSQMNEDSEPEKKVNRFLAAPNLAELGWLTNTPPPREYLFSVKEGEGFLPAGKTCMVISPGGVGKTFLLAHCALAAATGTEWLHTKANKPVKVLFVAAEEGKEELWIRFHNQAKSLGFAKNPNLFELALKNTVPFSSCGTSPMLVDGKGNVQKFYEELKEYIETDHEIKLVILDPASRFMGPETETNNAAATDFITRIETLTMLGGKPTVLISHHTNKEAIGSPKGGSDRIPFFSASFSRGASALVDGVRWMMGIQRSEAKESYKSIFIKMLKSNYSKLGPILEFEQDFEDSGLLRYIGEASEKESKPYLLDEPVSISDDGNNNTLGAWC